MNLSGISLDLANRFYSYGWRASIIGAAITAVGVLSLFVGTRVRDHYFEHDIAELNNKAAQANEHAAVLKKQTAELQKEAEAAKADAAKANQKILEMQKMRSLQKSQAEALKQLFQSTIFQTDPKPIIELAAVADAEAQTFAWELQNFFASCEVGIPGYGGFPLECRQAGPDPNGMVLTVRSIEETFQPFAHFQRVMHGIGLPIEVNTNAGLAQHRAVLNVLRKPA